MSIFDLEKNKYLRSLLESEGLIIDREFRKKNDFHQSYINIPNSNDYRFAISYAIKQKEFGWKGAVCVEKTSGFPSQRYNYIIKYKQNDKIKYADIIVVNINNLNTVIGIVEADLEKNEHELFSSFKN